MRRIGKKNIQQVVAKDEQGNVLITFEFRNGALAIYVQDKKITLERATRNVTKEFMVIYDELDTLGD